MHARLAARLLTAVAVLCAPALPTAQEQTSRAEGTVRDQQGGILIGVTVEARNLVSAVLSALFDLLVAVVPLMIVLAWIGVPLAPTQLWALPLLVLLGIFVCGLGMALAAANLYFRDVKYIVEVLLTFAIFFTPVFYSSELLGSWREVILLNPVASVLEGLDRSVVQGRTPDLAWIAYSATASIVTFILAWLLFHRLEHGFADNV